MSKRLFDIFFSLLALILLSWVIVLGYIIASIDTRSSGLFVQERVGQYGKIFKIFKLKTFHPLTQNVSSLGNFLRRYKIDELPQLLNVLIGDMSLVGPRPDIPGYYDLLEGEDRKVLELKPGITSLASIKYANEEQLLAAHPEPLKYNDQVLFPDKVQMNLDYYHHRSLWLDLKIIFKTFV